MKYIKGFEGEYSITQDGKVFSHKSKRFLNLRGSGKDRTGKKRLYRTVCLSKGKGMFDYRYVHRLVAEAYIPNPDGLKYINHKSGDGSDNRVENLEWCTPDYNSKYTVKLNRSTRGEKNPRAKLTEEKVREILKKYIPVKYSIYILAREYGVSPYTIHLIVKGKNWSHIK